MLNYIWSGMMLLSVVCALALGRVPQLSSAVMQGASDAVNLLISILGMMAFWSGILKIAEKSGLTDYISKLFKPFIKFLFPECKNNPDAEQFICMNITANLLGLGNAATPFGLKAMKSLQKQNKKNNVATNAMAMFVVVNTASLQLLPTLLCTLRQKYGSQNPMSILIYLWMTSFVALAVGVTLAKFCEKKGG